MGRMQNKFFALEQFHSGALPDLDSGRYVYYYVKHSLSICKGTCAGGLRCFRMSRCIPKAVSSAVQAWAREGTLESYVTIWGRFSLLLNLAWPYPGLYCRYLFLCCGVSKHPDEVMLRQFTAGVRITHPYKSSDTSSHSVPKTKTWAMAKTLFSVEAGTKKHRSQFATVEVLSYT